MKKNNEIFTQSFFHTSPCAWQGEKKMKKLFAGNINKCVKKHCEMIRGSSQFLILRKMIGRVEIGCGGP